MKHLGKKFNGGALLFALIISVLILILISSIISINYYYSLKFSYNLKLNQLKNNIESVTQLALADFSEEPLKEGIDLFGNGNDSVNLIKWNYGLFDGFEIEAHYKNIAIKKRAICAYEFGEEPIFYLADHGRVISIAGKTEIYKNCFFPKAGYQSANIGGNGMQSEPFKGTKQNAAEFPKLNEELETKVKKMFSAEYAANLIYSDRALLEQDSLINSFSNASLVFNISGNYTLYNKFIDGNVIINCSGKIYIKNNCKLNGILIKARCVEFEKATNFSGQIFVADTLLAQNECVFNYPTIFVLNEEKNKAGLIDLGKQTNFNGLIIGCRDKNTINVPYLFKMGEASVLNGQLFFEGTAALAGELNGDIYIEQSNVCTSSSENSNSMYNTIINKNKINKRLCYFRLLQKEKKSMSTKKGILKWVY